MTVALDIGGTLAKVAYVQPSTRAAEVEQTFFGHVPPVKYDQHVICFRYFETKQIDQLIDFVRSKLAADSPRVLVAGGGAYKYYEQLKKTLDADVVRCEEMNAVVSGLVEVLAHVEFPIHRFNLEKREKEALPRADLSYPLLLVNIGSGVSIIKVNGPDDYVRVSGTCIGGGTVLGLCKLRFGTTTFQEVIELSSQGESSLDLTVSDLVGDTAGSTKLPPDLLAASFGKLHNNKDFIEVTAKNFAYSAIRMVSYNLGYLGYLFARLHGCNAIIYGGKYVSDHVISMMTITEGVLFSQLYEQEEETLDEAMRKTSYADKLKEFQTQPGLTQAYFLRHDGYLGAIGILTKALKSAVYTHF